LVLRAGVLFQVCPTLHHSSCLMEQCQEIFVSNFFVKQLPDV
jgi:hypothetical protein